jgi:hypothetical protein
LSRPGRQYVTLCLFRSDSGMRWKNMTAPYILRCVHDGRGHRQNGMGRAVGGGISRTIHRFRTAATTCRIFLGCSGTKTQPWSLR